VFQKNLEQVLVLLRQFFLDGSRQLAAAVGRRVLRNISTLASLTRLRTIDIQFGDVNRQTQLANFGEKVVLQIRIRPGEVRVRLRPDGHDRHVLRLEIFDERDQALAFEA
jgi:hypothetical protein